MYIMFKTARNIERDVLLHKMPPSGFSWNQTYNPGIATDMLYQLQKHVTGTKTFCNLGLNEKCRKQ